VYIIYIYTHTQHPQYLHGIFTVLFSPWFSPRYTRKRYQFYNSNIQSGRYSRYLKIRVLFYKENLICHRGRSKVEIEKGIQNSKIHIYEGKLIRKSGNKVDGYGGGLIKSQMCGDRWRKRHDKLKLFLHEIMCWAKMKCAVEVYNEFARFISINFIDPDGVQAAMVALNGVETRLTAAILEEHAAAQISTNQ